MRWNYIWRRRIKLCATLIAVFLLYMNIQFLTENTPTMLTGKATGNVDMCTDEYMAFPSIGTLSIRAKQQFTYDFNVTNEASYSTLIYGDNSSLININTATGLVQFTPRDDQVGAYWINVTARNDFCDNNDTTVVFLLNVTPSNYAPSLSMADQTLTEDTLYTYNVSQNATDADGDAIKYYDNTAMFVIGEESGIIAFTPTNDNVGTHTVRIYVVDTQSALGWQDVAFTINNANDAPVLSTIGAKTAYVGEPWNTSLVATDVDANEQLTFRSNYTNFLASSGKISTVNSIVNYSLNMTTNWTANGTYNINITVNDTSGTEDSEVISFTILYRNNPPNITAYTPSDLTPSATQNTQQAFNITATDPDGTTPSAKWYVDDADTSEATYSYTYTASTAGTFNITAVITDGEINDSISWILTVTAAPTVTPPTQLGGGTEGIKGIPKCKPLWTCTDWSPCQKEGVQLRECTDVYKCGTLTGRPHPIQNCTYVEHPSCFDGVKNQDEILADCGGVCKECPSCMDGIQNQGETGMDCGGPCPACKHVETPKLLAKYRDKVISPLEVFTYPNESWTFWALLPIMLFVIYRTARIVTRLRKTQPAPKKENKLEHIERLIKVTEQSIKEKDYTTAKTAYAQIKGLYNQLPAKDKSKVYGKITDLNK